MAAKLTSAVLVALVALTLASAPAPAEAAPATTAPGKHVLVYFVFTDKWLRYQIYRTTAGGGSDQLFLEKWVVRGDQATIIVINRGKKPHGLEFYGHKVGPLRPGKRQTFSATLLRRGSFPYESTTDRGKTFRGKFPIN